MNHEQVNMEFRSSLKTAAIDFPPRVEGQFFGGNVDQAAADIVDQDINRSVLRDDIQALQFRGLGIGKIRLDFHGLPAERPDVIGSGLEAFCVASREHNISAGFRDGQCHLAPQPPTTARDEKSLALQFKSIQHAHGSAHLTLLTGFTIRWPKA